jgi:1-acyl-sn-glycerol-3-phosphate acyltransferase
MLKQALHRMLIPPRLEALLDATAKPVGSLGYDRWGFRSDTNRWGVGTAKLLYDHFFHAEALGLENIPASGRVLIISNHSGYLPVDAILIGVALCTNPHAPRMPRAMIERFLPTIPYIGNWMNAVGAVVGDVQNCIDMLNQDEAVMVFPEGVRGTGKGYLRRYQLQRFGCGFLNLALETGTPIVPVGVAGCEESLPMFGNIRALARAVALPYVPVALPFPLPTKVVISFGKPMHFSGPVVSEARTRAHVEEVKAAIRELINQGLARRGEQRLRAT